MVDADLHDESLFIDAKKKTGLDDAGDEDFKEPLRILLRALREEARLSEFGRGSARLKLLRHLTNRLRIRADVVAHPEIAKVALPGPVFVTGMPRAGTTFAHKLLAQNPAFRAPLFWEMAVPSPPPDARTRDTDPRIKIAEDVLEEMYRLVPHAKAIHFMAAREPHECHELLENAFTSRLLDAFFHIPSYAAWLRQSDFTPAYRYYQLQLKLLTWKSPGEHLLLKDPLHIWDLDALLSVFPDARIVMLHRSPIETVGSFSSLASTVRASRSDHVDREVVGRHVLDKLSDGVTRMMQFRKANPERGRFCDVSYTALVRDPVRTARSIHESFGLELPVAVDARLASWLAENRQHKHGVHGYELADFGLSAGQIRDRFADYTSRFDVA